MKFFVPLESCSMNSKDVVYPSDCFYGPFKDEQEAQSTINRLWPYNNEMQFLIFDGTITNSKPSKKEKPDSEKREPGDMNNYIKVAEGYVCKDCGEQILGATVAHPIHIKEMPGTGFGECKYKEVPYCPVCEKKPNFHGEPILAPFGIKE